MTEAPEVMQCMSVTGEVDFVLTLTMRDMLEYESFAQKHFWGDPNVKRFSTLVVMNQVKQAVWCQSDNWHRMGLRNGV